jgi:YggT family protein
MDFFTTLLNILCVSIGIFLSVLELCFFVRAILSFINPEEEGFLAGILYVLTEPVILPVRALLAKLHFGENSPIDLSFLFAFILLSIVNTMLPAISL